nr:cell division cycle protein 27 homolog B-like isoform X2 [Ziziphus jujuba var. spinosa]XP_048332766.1 cell division cycle protein 27 homolog B-like isoform X2 [Ziziphus jujuba var. spinosa]
MQGNNWLDVATPPLCRNFQQNDHNATMLGADSSPRSLISSRVLFDSGTQRSTRLSGEAVANTNTASTVVSGNGTSNSSKYLEGSKRSSMALRSVSNSTSASSACGGARCLKLEEFPLPVGVITMNGSRVYSGMSEILGLLGILGEGCIGCLSKTFAEAPSPRDLDGKVTAEGS